VKIVARTRQNPLSSSDESSQMMQNQLIKSPLSRMAHQVRNETAPSILLF